MLHSIFHAGSAGYVMCKITHDLPQKQIFGRSIIIKNVIAGICGPPSGQCAKRKLIKKTEN